MHECTLQYEVNATTCGVERDIRCHSDYMLKIRSKLNIKTYTAFFHITEKNVRAYNKILS